MKKKILIVEDEGIVALDLQDQLQFMGYHVIGIADTAKDALKMAAKESPDLVLMDIIIKGERDGIDIARQLHDLFDIPVVFLTAYADEKTLARAKLSQPYGYIIKPFNANMIRSNIEMALHRHEVDQALVKCYSTTLSRIGDAVISFDCKGKIRYLNAMAEALTGWKAKDAVKQHLSEVFILVDTKNNADTPLNPLQFLASHQLLSHPSGFELHSKFGTVIPIGFSIIPLSTNKADLFDETGIIIFSDKREHLISERQAKMAEKLFDNSIEGIVLTDSNLRIQQINKTFTEVTGYEIEDVIGKRPSILQSGQHERDFYKDMWATLKRNGMWQGQISNKRKSGEVYLEWLSIYSIKNKNAEIINYIGLFSDLTEKRMTEDHIHNLSHYDALTGLPNRLMFMERLKQSIVIARRAKNNFVLFFIDLDGFKKINDSLGHEAGDVLLQEISMRLNALMRESDTVCRLGGDEFTVIIPAYTSMSDIVTVARKILSELSRVVKISERSVYVSASIGISLYPNDGEDIQELVKNADTAMYAAKDKGKNRYEFYDNEMNRRTLERLTLESCIHRAYDEKKFEIYYQPKIDLYTGSICGAEALIRWFHSKEIGYIAPSQFIPLTEETGMIIPIGEWVLRQVCKDMQEWEEQGIVLFPISVNLSAVQFRDFNLIKMIDTVLSQSQIDPKYIDLEITEGMLMDDIQNSLKMMNQIRGLGVSLSIDDFGTGYSSLKYLKLFPVDTLKIDKSFIDEVPGSPGDCAIVKTIIDLAHNLKMNIVAEGIEKPEQAKFLLENGCCIGQGFYYSHAVTAEELALIIRHG